MVPLFSAPWDQAGSLEVVPRLLPGDSGTRDGSGPGASVGRDGTGQMALSTPLACRAAFSALLRVSLWDVPLPDPWSWWQPVLTGHRTCSQGAAPGGGGMESHHGERRARFGLVPEEETSQGAGGLHRGQSPA